MNTNPKPENWDALCALPDDEIPLLHASLLIARDEYPDLEIADYEALCDGYEQALRPRTEPIEDAPMRLAAINRYLYEDLGFSGNQQDYYDPRNSYLNDVLERKLGIPISLGVIQMELARRTGVPLEGVSFPGHFLVRLPVEGGLVVLDPYQKGRSVDADELKIRARPHLGGNDIDDQQLLQILAPASHRAILMRMLRNLKGLYTEREAWEKALRCADRLVRLDGSQADEIRDRGLLYARVGYGKGAHADLSHYLQMRPDASDVESVRSTMIESGDSVGRLN